MNQTTMLPSLDNRRFSIMASPERLRINSLDSKQLGSIVSRMPDLVPDPEKGKLYNSNGSIEK